MGSMKTLMIQRQHLPEKPGVYIYRDARRKVLYVGKAKNLKRRVSSYFQRTASLEPSKQQMVKKIADIDTTVVGSETEALLLEATLIKKHHPPYNIVLRDDKNFLYIKIPLKEEFPTVTTARRVHADGARYFGPYTSAAAARSTLKLLKRLFLFRTCKPHQGRPCFDVHLGRCLGPCDDRITAAAYRKRVVIPIMLFLQGNTGVILRQLSGEMTRAAKARQYERAAFLRDRIGAVQGVTARQSVISAAPERFDIISAAREHDWACINLFQVRQGKLIAKHNFLLQQQAATPESELIAAFLGQYYPYATDKPKLVITGTTIPDAASLGRLLGCTIRTAQRGKKLQLARLGEENAREYLDRQRVQWLADTNRSRRTLEALMAALQLKKVPQRIEAFDISNIQGTNAVGSMVVFERAMPRRTEYRKFTIRHEEGSNDPAMMAEMLVRRLHHDDWPKPDLIILDGGKGQLSVVRHAAGAQLAGLPIVALAKREEELFLPGKAEPVRLPAGSDQLFLVQRIRDEAHRFAITFYRTKHGLATTRSALDDIPGIGPALKRRLLKKFGSVAAIKTQSRKELASVVGTAKAAILHRHLPFV